MLFTIAIAVSFGVFQVGAPFGFNTLVIHQFPAQEYYLKTPPLNRASEATINSIGTLAVGLEFITMPLAILIAQRRPRWNKTMMWIALLVFSGSLVIASFATAVGWFIGNPKNIIWPT